MKKKEKENILYKIENLIFRYDLGKEKVEAIRNLTFDIPAHSFITLSGPSGSGKSTLLNLLGLIEPIQRGRILFLGKNLDHLKESEKNEIRKHKIGFIFQQFHLIPVLTVEENVAYFLIRQGINRREVRERVKEAIEAVGLWDHRKKKPSQLSGGQKQRVAIARAIAKKPEVIIGDEPTASLDQKTGHEIIEILVKMVMSYKTSIILTTHDPMVQTYSQQNFHLQDGQLILG